MIVVVIALACGKAIFITDKHLCKREKCTLSRGTMHIAEMTTDKHVSK